MIRKTVENTINSTFCILDGNPVNNAPNPIGTGFFISKNGFFLTALHVIKGIKNLLLYQPKKYGDQFITEVRRVKSWPNYDISLLKIENSHDLPFLIPDFQEHIEGTPIYSFGYPTSEIIPFKPTNPGLENLIAAKDNLFPRVTSAIISSRYYVIDEKVNLPEAVKYYVLDKELIDKNSGGPIVLTESGNVIALYSFFEHMEYLVTGRSELETRSHIKPYGIATRLSNIKNYLEGILD